MSQKALYHCAGPWKACTDSGAEPSAAFFSWRCHQCHSGPDQAVSTVGLLWFGQTLSESLFLNGIQSAAKV